MTMAQTPLLIKPTLQQVEMRAKQIGLTRREAEKFWHYYEANGWRVGRNLMRNWHAALAGWKMRFEERVGPQGEPKKTIVQSDLGKMLDRIERKK